MKDRLLLVYVVGIIGLCALIVVVIGLNLNDPTPVENNTVTSTKGKTTPAVEESAPTEELILIPIDNRDAAVRVIPKEPRISVSVTGVKNIGKMVVRSRVLRPTKDKAESTVVILATQQLSSRLRVWWSPVTIEVRGCEVEVEKKDDHTKVTGRKENSEVFELKVKSAGYKEYKLVDIQVSSFAPRFFLQ